MAEPSQTLTLEQALELASQHHKAGRLPESEAIYQQILKENPEQVDAVHMLGVLAYQVGKHELAIELITKATTLQPNSPEAFCTWDWLYRL